ncbi:adenylate/guanylate cyclase domain-containing protein [Paenibacillus ginsengarvi]|uniref:HAMP domain-containing protein n=1 Tax=Paenibacillus ginsengarvi TaxID=400777 RepID=A0A3B0CIZ7_9BACL|nr:adenylate/guanylate cyclase domain-containing protein [Paenibacillus ginsengarvi]RKN84811.1 HAMP domain-containing protein [Paenibacillus ginsengarvi]
MKKPVAVLLLVLLLAAVAGTYAFQERRLLKQNPLNRELPFVSLSKAIADPSDNLYVIDNSKKTIHKLEKDGTLLFSIHSEVGKNGEQFRFNDMIVDEQNRLYTVRTLLDPYGLTVKSEQIVRFGADGSFDRVIFNQDYDDKMKRYRIGSLKSPQLEQGDLIFYNDEVTKVTEYRLRAGEDEAKPMFVFDMPANKYLADIDGVKPGSIYYSTRSGELYSVKLDGKSEMIYPLPGLDRTRRNFPESIRLDGKGRIVYIDYFSKAISRFDPLQPYIVEELVNEAIEEESGIRIPYKKPEISLSQDGDIIIVDDQQLDRRYANGTFAPSLNNALYSDRYVAYRWLVWATAAVCALLLLAAVKLFLIDVLKRRTSLLFKQIVVFVPAVVAAMVVLSMFIYNNFVEKMEQETYRELSLLAANGQNLVDGDKLEALNSPIEYRGETYNEFRKKIDAVFDNSSSSENRGFYKAVYKVENGLIYRIVEDDDEMHMFNPFPMTDENRQVVEQGKVANGGWTDDTGSWSYGIAPITNSAGKIVGVFETSKNMESLLIHRRSVMQSIVRNIVIVTACLLLVLLLMTFIQLSSLRKLRKSVGDIARGNWETEVKIRTRDEIADLGESVNTMAARIREYIMKVEAFSEAYYRFVPQQFLRFLNKHSILDVRLGDQVEQNMSTMICNIRSFYTMSKLLTPEQNFNFVNSFLNRFGPYVRNHQGMINKYLGAGFMALFPGSADEALRASVEMRRELDLYNTHRNHSGYRPVDIGIGLHKGPLRLGIIGEEQRLESNVISDNVNISIILEKLTEPLGASILITDNVVQSLSDASRFGYRNLGMIQVGGIKEPLHLYDVYEGDPDTIRTLKERTKARFEEAVTYYQVGRFHDAREAFLMVIKMNRQDKAAQLYFYLCDEYYQNGTTEDWNGTLSVS